MIHKQLLAILCLLLAGNLAVAGDETIINELCQKGGVVQLEGKTYTIKGQIRMPSNTELRGTEGTVLFLADECGLAQNLPVIDLQNVKNIKISHIKFNGNQDRQTYAVAFNPNHPESKKRWGNQFNTFIFAQRCDNITVTNCDFFDNLGDGLRLNRCTNVEFAYNTGSMGGHDTFFALRSQGLRVHDNNIKPLVNSAIRVLDCSHVRIYNNTIEFAGPRDAGPNLQIQHDTGTMKDVEVCGNVLKNSWGPGLWLVGKTSGSDELWLHHNLFLNSGQNRAIFWVGGIIASGYDAVRIEHNVFDGSFLGAVNFYAVSKAWATEASATLDSNIFINAIPGTHSNVGGYGIYNAIARQKVTSTNNCYYNNAGGNTFGDGVSTSPSDVFVNPKGNPTPSGWTWTGSTWKCPEVKPLPMEPVPPAAPAPSPAPAPGASPGDQGKSPAKK